MPRVLLQRAAGKARKEFCRRCAAILVVGIVLFGATASKSAAQARTTKQNACCSEKHPAESETRAAERFSARVAALLADAPVSKGEWGVLVVDGESGETLFALNSEKYFPPASNLKLFTTALALATLGVDYRFRTTLETRATLSSNGVLAGDLFLVGRGDPNLSNRKFPYQGREEFAGPPEKVLAELAYTLVACGVKRITGDVVADDSYFPRERYPSGWEIDDTVWQYGAAVSAIAVDDNTVLLTLTPGAVASAPVQANVSPATQDFILQNEVLTSSANGKPDLRVVRELDSGIAEVSGTLPARGALQKLTLAVHHPAEHAAVLLAQLLQERGVQMTGSARAVHVSEVPNLPAPTVLAEHVSVPLGESVKLVNKISENLHAEMLLRDAARETGLWATPEALAKFPASFYAAAGISASEVIQTDGSGLSRKDLVTPHAVTSLLWYAEKQPWFAPFFDSLPVAGVDGTLEERMKNTVAAGRVHAKTGSVENVRALSGYAELQDGRRLIFSFLSSEQAGKNHEAAEALDRLCVAMMEEFGSEK